MIYIIFKYLFYQIDYKYEHVFRKKKYVSQEKKLQQKFPCFCC